MLFTMMCIFTHCTHKYNKKPVFGKGRKQAREWIAYKYLLFIGSLQLFTSQIITSCNTDMNQNTR